MERVVIFGGYDFVGYHLSRFLINEGIETVIVDHNELTPLQIDRLDTIGRNALLSRTKLDSLDTVQEIRNVVDCVFFVYKPYNNNSSIDSEFIISELKKAIKVAQIKGAKLIIFSSIKTDDYESNISDYKEIEDFLLSKTKKYDVRYNVIKSPYIYGPWCEEDCIIQKMIISKLDNQQVEYEFDYPGYLYITDLAIFLHEVATQSMDEKVIYYLPEEANQISKLNNWFGINRKKQSEEKLVNLNSIDIENKIIRSKSCVGIMDGLTKTESFVKLKLKNKTD